MNAIEVGIHCGSTGGSAFRKCGGNQSVFRLGFLFSGSCCVEEEEEEEEEELGSGLELAAEEEEEEEDEDEDEEDTMSE